MTGIIIGILIFGILFLIGVLGVMFWFISKTMKNNSYAVSTLDDFQEMLENYASSLYEMSKMDEYYGDDTIKVAVKNTKLVIESCKSFKSNFIETEEEENLLDLNNEQR